MRESQWLIDGCAFVGLTVFLHSLHHNGSPLLGMLWLKRLVRHASQNNLLVVTTLKGCSLRGDSNDATSAFKDLVITEGYDDSIEGR